MTSPRDRNSEFEPKIVPKYQRNVSGIEEKVISLYGRGMSTRDIHDQLQDLYGIELSAEMVSKITDKILPEIREWQSRPLNPVYPFVFMDCIHYKVREDGQILSRAAYVVLGVTTEGYEEILSITVGANESSKFWMEMLSDLKKFSSDFKAVTMPRTRRLAWMRWRTSGRSGGRRYPYAVSNLENNWEDVSSFFQFPDEIRRIMYTTYTDEKTIPIFPEIPETTGDCNSSDTPLLRHSK